MNRRDQMEEMSKEFHREHPEVWKLFVRFAQEKIGLGHSHYGAKAIMERVRWETGEGGLRPRFKIGNNHAAFYARWFGHAYPHHAGFFFKRKQTSEKAPPLSEAAARGSDVNPGWWND